MDASHLEAVLAIERESFSIPWQQQAFVEELGHPDAWCFLAIPIGYRRPEVVGYLCFRRLLDEMHILRFAVQKGWRNRGVGCWLLSECLQLAVENGLRAAILEVRSSNRAAIALYEKLEFHTIGTRPNYYPETREDALVMMKAL